MDFNAKEKLQCDESEGALYGVTVYGASLIALVYTFDSATTKDPTGLN